MLPTTHLLHTGNRRYSLLNLTAQQMLEKRALNKSLISKITSAVATSRLKARKNRDLENETI